MRVILLGACGRMGKAVTELAEAQGVEIVCGVDLFPKPAPYPVYTSFADVKEEADVIIDFSSTEHLAERLAYAAEHTLPVVLAATGYTAADEALVREYATRVPLFKTGNLSLGINLLELLVSRAAKVLEGFDVEIIERHHNQKKDAPSGTALMLAESVKEASRTEKEAVYGRHGIVGAREPREIGIHAVRGGTIVGEHEVMFAGEDELITITHSARSRKVFASGALKAAAWLQTKSAGLYNMHDLLAEIVG